LPAPASPPWAPDPAPPSASHSASQQQQAAAASAATPPASTALTPAEIAARLQLLGATPDAASTPGIHRRLLALISNPAIPRFPTRYRLHAWTFLLHLPGNSSRFITMLYSTNIIVFIVIVSGLISMLSSNCASIT
jgi:hypothetical protein